MSAHLYKLLGHRCHVLLHQNSVFSRFDCSENVVVAVDSYSGDFSMWLVSTAAGLVGDL